MDGDKALLLGVVAVLLALSVMLVLPYLQFVVAAVFLAFVLRPLQVRLSDRIGKTPAATVLLLFSVVALVLPFFLLAAFIAGDVIAFAQNLQEAELDYEAIEEPVADVVGVEIDVQSILGSLGDRLGDMAFGEALTAFGVLTHFLIGLGLLIFLLFYFTRDGDKLVEWSRKRLPFPREVTNDLVSRYRGITNAVLAGHVLVAIIQGVLAGIGLFVVGIPNAIFWTFVMILLALIPLVGAFVVVIPASIYLLSIGDVVAGIGLFVFGVVLVGATDDYLRPFIVDRYAQVSPSVILVGVLGGLAVFGFMGIFVGPVVVGALRETVEVYHEHYGFETGSGA